MERSNRDNRDQSSAEADLGGAYNEFWWDRGVHAARVNGKTRTSLIVGSAGRQDSGVDAGRPGARRARAPRRGGCTRPTVPRIDRWPSGACCSTPGRRCCPGPYNNYVQLFQTPGPRGHLQRDGPRRPHRPAGWSSASAAGASPLQGDPRGRWDGNTLVVETTNFTDKTNVRGSGEQLRLVERFTRADANTLLYEFTVDDPASFTKPWSAGAADGEDRRIRSTEYACHEGNYAMSGILRGARWQEKRERVKRSADGSPSVCASA